MRFRDRVARFAGRSHLPRRTVRVRLTALYGALFLASGVALLLITYLLVSHDTGACSTTEAPNGAAVTLCASGGLGDEIVRTGEGSSTAPPSTEGSPTQQTAGQADGPLKLTPQQAKAQTRLLQTQAATQRDAQLHQLLVQSGIALGAMAIVSIALGWVVAGRVLRPLRTITSAARRISATSLHERLAMNGPDDELKELGDTFDDLLARLERSFEAQRRFVANASHELRTPLARQRTVAQVALADPDATVDSLRVAHESVLASGAEQERLIDALLTLARGQAGPRTREGVDLASVTSDVLITKGGEAERRGVEIHEDLSPAPATGDRRLVERLIVNLIDNALTYNQRRGEVDVVVGTRVGRAVVSVTNTGPLVAPTEVERLLQPFQRNGPDRVDQGHRAGLGLSIVQAIAEAHGAEMDVSPRDGGGLAVRVTFPSIIETSDGAASTNRSDDTPPIAS